MQEKDNFTYNKQRSVGLEFFSSWTDRFVVCLFSFIALSVCNAELCVKTERDWYCVIYFVHRIFINSTHFFFEPFFVDCSYLFKQNNAVFGESRAVSVQWNVGRQICLWLLTCNCGGNYSRTESVADIILNNKHRSDSALLRAYNGTQVGIINISSSYIPGFHAPNNCLLVFLPFQ